MLVIYIKCKKLIKNSINYFHYLYQYQSKIFINLFNKFINFILCILKGKIFKTIIFGVIASLIAAYIWTIITRPKEIGPKYETTIYKSNEKGTDFCQAVSFELKKEGEYDDIRFLTFSFDTVLSISVPPCKYEVPLTALAALIIADIYSLQWNKKAALIYISSGANKAYAKSDWQTYIQSYRWCFLYRFNKKLLLVIVDGKHGQPEIICGWEIENAPNEYLNMEPIKDLRVDSDEAILIVLNDNPYLIMDSGAIICMHETLRSSSGPMWIIQYGGGYTVSAKSPIITEKNILFSVEDIENRVVMENINIKDDIYLRAISYNVSYYTPDGIINKIEKKEICTMAILKEIINSLETTYKYNNCIELVFGVPSAAITTSNNIVFAEAKLISPLFSTSEILIEEIHYKDGKIIYKGTATYSIGSGIRKKYFPEVGEMKNDYYPTWPTRH